MTRQGFFLPVCPYPGIFSVSHRNDSLFCEKIFKRRPFPFGRGGVFQHEQNQKQRAFTTGRNSCSPRCTAYFSGRGIRNDAGPRNHGRTALFSGSGAMRKRPACHRPHTAPCPRPPTRRGPCGHAAGRPGCSTDGEGSREYRHPRAKGPQARCSIPDCPGKPRRKWGSCPRQ